MLESEDVALDQKNESVAQLAAALRGRAALLPIERLRKVERLFFMHRSSGALGRDVDDGVLARIRFVPPFDFPRLRSVCVVAIPTAPRRFSFHLDGEVRRFMIPPAFSEVDAETDRSIVASWAAGRGHAIADARLPLKTVAVCSGLARWGRNNLVFVDGFGSLLRLVGFYTDLGCASDPWTGFREVERCRICVGCLRRCPTGAIRDDRYLLYADRCLSRMNTGLAPLPEMIRGVPWDSLVGCMTCQRICPENVHRREWFDEGAEFSEEESVLLRDGVPLERLSEETRAKLIELAAGVSLDLILRNLAFVLARPSVEPCGTRRAPRAAGHARNR